MRRRGQAQREQERQRAERERAEKHPVFHLKLILENIRKLPHKKNVFRLQSENWT